LAKLWYIFEPTEPKSLSASTQLLLVITCLTGRQVKSNGKKNNHKLRYLLVGDASAQPKLLHQQGQKTKII